MAWRQTEQPPSCKGARSILHPRHRARSTSRAQRFVHGGGEPRGPFSPRATRDAATSDYTDRPEYDIKPRLSAPTNNPPGTKDPKGSSCPRQ